MSNISVLFESWFDSFFSISTLKENPIHVMPKFPYVGICAYQPDSLNIAANRHQNMGRTLLKKKKVFYLLKQSVQLARVFAQNHFIV